MKRLNFIKTMAILPFGVTLPKWISIDNVETLTEFERCKTDITYFVENYMKIQTVENGLIPFKLYPFQKEILQSLVSNTKHMICSARQMGMDNLLTVYSIHSMFFNDNFTTINFSVNRHIEQKNKDRFFQNLNELYALNSSIPVLPNQRDLKFSNGSYIKYTNVTTDKKIKSIKPSLIISNDFAFNNRQEDIYQYMRLVPSAKIIIQSTPNVKQNLFYKLWKEENQFKKLKYDWRDHPERDEEWLSYKKKTYAFDENLFNSEINGNFKEE